MSPAILISAAVLLAVLSFLFLFTRRRNPPLPPGPLALPLIGNLASLDPELHSYFGSLARKHGPILRLKLGQKLGIVISSPALAREILKDQDVAFANRDVPDVARAVAYGGSDIVWTPYGAEWRMLRKVCVLKMLSNTTLDSVYGLRRRELRRTVGFMAGRAGSEVDFGEQMFLTVMNVVTSMMWGGTVGEGEEREKLGAEFRRLVSEITELLGSPNLSDFFPALSRFDLQGLSKKVHTAGMSFDAIFEEVISRRTKIEEAGEKKGGADFLEFLMKLVKDEGGDAKTPLTMTHLKALLMDMIVGGTDTSANSIEFAMAEVLNNPQVLKRAQQELDEVVGKENVVEESHIHNLPYLNCIMKESLRLHPALPLLVPHCNPSQDCVVGGYTVPKGSRVFVNVWSIHRDPSVWKDPLEFRPERFIDSNWDYSGNDLTYFPFGSGRRICAGIAMAERMFLFSLATFLHSFDWKLARGKKNVDLTEKFGIVLKLKSPLVAVPVPRLPNSSQYE
ncbi:3,9-dihydroxypterocarpan 6A-monooxygenase [Linum perenne]